MTGWSAGLLAVAVVLGTLSLAALLWSSYGRPRQALYVLFALTPTQFIFVPVSNFFISPADILVMAAAAALLVRLSRRDHRARTALRLHLPLGLMIVSYVFGFFVLDHWSRTLVRVPMAIVPSVLACELLAERRHLAAAAAALIVAGLLDGGYGAFWYAGGEWLHPSRFSGMMGVNFSATAMMTAAVIAMARLARTQRPLKLILPVGLTTMALATLSKMAFVTLTMTWALVLWRLVCRVNRRILVGSVLLILMVGLSQTAVRETLLARAGAELQQDGVARSSTHVRLLILRAAWHGFVEQPLFGVGYRNFEKHSIRESAIERSTHGEGYATHNTYLEVLVEGGLLAFIPFVYFLYVLVRGALALRHRITREHDLVVSAAIVGLPVALLSAVAANVMLHYLFWAIVGLALACARTVALKAEARPPEPPAAAP